MNVQIKVQHTRQRQHTRNGVDVWLAFLDTPSRRFEGLLSPDELGRADRFYFRRDRDRFIARRGILRILLGSYLGTGPESVRLSRGEKGKPEIAGACGGERLHFNLSQSENMAVYAFSCDCEVGVDIEYIRDDIEMEQLVERFFSLREKEEWRKLPPGRRREAFFHGWTRKEAFTKAAGEGLFMSLDSFDVSLAPDEPARLLGLRGDAGPASEWTVEDLDPPAGFAAALAAEGQIGSVNLRQWAS